MPETLDDVLVRTGGTDTPTLAEPILRSIPEWFGIEESTLAYIAATARLPTWIAWHHGTPVGFVTVQRHFPRSAEIHCIAVHRSSHGRGVGTAMIRAIESFLHADGVEYLQVKTLGPSRPSPEYTRTTRFYESRGFVAIEEICGLWPGIPALLLVKRLSP